MPRVDVDISDNDILGILETQRFDMSTISIDSVRRQLWRIIASDIQNGDAPWPVDTGYSRANFYQSRGELYNHADYVNYIRKGRAVSKLQSWINRTLRSAVREAALFTGGRYLERGMKRQSNRAAERRLLRTAARLLSKAFLGATPVRNRSVVNAFLADSLRRELSLEHRRRVRIYRPEGYRDYINPYGRSRGR